MPADPPADPPAADLLAAYEALVKWGRSRAMSCNDPSDDYCTACQANKAARLALTDLADSLAAREAGHVCTCATDGPGCGCDKGAIPPKPAPVLVYPHADCPECGGQGWTHDYMGNEVQCGTCRQRAERAPAAPPKPCERCDGRGAVSARTHAEDERIVCPACGGAKGVG